MNNDELQDLKDTLELVEAELYLINARLRLVGSGLVIGDAVVDVISVEKRFLTLREKYLYKQKEKIEKQLKAETERRDWELRTQQR